MRSVWSSDLGEQHSGQDPGLRSRGRRRRTLRERTYPSADPPHVARVPHFCSTTSWERTRRAVTACALHLDGRRTPCSLSFHRAAFLGAPQESSLRRRGCLDARRVALEAPSCYRQWGQSRHEMSPAQYTEFRPHTSQRSQARAFRSVESRRNRFDFPTLHRGTHLFLGLQRHDDELTVLRRVEHAAKLRFFPTSRSMSSTKPAMATPRYPPKSGPGG